MFMTSVDLALPRRRLLGPWASAPVIPPGRSAVSRGVLLTLAPTAGTAASALVAIVGPGRRGGLPGWRTITRDCAVEAAPRRGDRTGEDRPCVHPAGRHAPRVRPHRQGRRGRRCPWPPAPEPRPR